jgi:hypothetical protein
MSLSLVFLPVDPLAARAQIHSRHSDYAGGYLDHPPHPLVSPALTGTVAQQTTIGSPAFIIKYVHHLGDLLGMMPGITAVKVSLD